MTEELPFTHEIRRIEEDPPESIEPEALVAASDLTADDVELANETARQAARGRPVVTLTEYQKRIVTDPARFFAAMICRQGGKTFAAMLRVVRKVVATPLTYYTFSRSQRQSANAVAQGIVHLKAQSRALAARGKTLAPVCSSQRFLVERADGREFIYRRLSAALPNGSRIVGLPASPDTTVGISGAMYCDEFALHRDSREIYARLFPVVSRRRAYEFLITSTPRGVGNKFHEIMTGQDFAEIFARLGVDIFAAVEQGLRLFDYKGNLVEDADGIERLRRALSDPDAWDEDYLCRFVDDVLNLLTYELIGRCERLHGPDGKPYEDEFVLVDDRVDYDPARDDLGKMVSPHLGKGDLFLGFDQARTKHLSVIWLDEAIGDETWCRALVVMRDKDFEFQEAALWQLMALPRLRLAGIDATGLGRRTAERTATKFGARCVPIDFSSRLTDRRGESHPVKSLLARVILERHQDGRDHYPVDDRIRDDFHRVKRRRQAGSPDRFTYFADDDETGHADIFTAKALADVVAQELREYSGRVEALRIVEPEPADRPGQFRLFPDPTEDLPPRADAIEAISRSGI